MGTILRFLAVLRWSCSVLLCRFLDNTYARHQAKEVRRSLQYGQLAVHAGVRRVFF